MGCDMKTETNNPYGYKICYKEDGSKDYTSHFKTYTYYQIRTIVYGHFYIRHILTFLLTLYVINLYIIFIIRIMVKTLSIRMENTIVTVLYLMQMKMY